MEADKRSQESRGARLSPAAAGAKPETFPGRRRSQFSGAGAASDGFLSAGL